MLLLIGDIFVLYSALWLSLIVRYDRLPSYSLLTDHVPAFSLLFIIWLTVFYLFDFYGVQSPALKRKLTSRLLQAQLFNAVIGTFFFYFAPGIAIAPRVVLLYSLVFSTALLLWWRIRVAPRLYAVRKERVAMFVDSEELQTLREGIEHNPEYSYEVVDCSLPEIADRKVTTIILDLRNEKTQKNLQDFYRHIFHGVRFIDAYSLYEDIYDRVPLSVISEGWFLEHVSGRSFALYDVAKRAMDLLIAIPLFVFSLPLYPVVSLMLYLQDGDSPFFVQERIGKHNSIIRVPKFRSWYRNQYITPIGSFLRKTRIDELPQLYSVIVGDMSLVGPRPEIPHLAEAYRKAIPFYDMRHIITPGLSGWAQIYHENHPHHTLGVEETREKLAYDLYYVKNRSFLLDLKIALKTVKVLLSGAGR